MQKLAIYWIIGCIMMGAGAGLHEARCPNDPVPSPLRLIVEVAIWPAGFSWAIANRKLRACERPSNQ